MTIITTDVLVVGLGPGGGAAAAAAARGGLDVLAIDRRHEVGMPVQCAEFIPLPLARWAQSPGVVRQRISGMKSILPSGRVVSTAFSGLMVDRAAFDRALAAAAADAGATLRLSTRLIDLTPAGRVARLESNAGKIEVRYRLLIAADGPHSPVARALGLPALRTVNTRQYTVPLNRPFADTDVWLAGRYPGGYAWLFPKGDVANLGLGMDPRFDGDMKTPLDELHRQLVGEGRVGAEILCRTGGAIPVGGLRARLVEGDIVFVGDAGGFTHPVSGAGIAAAVISGEHAGDAACALLLRNDPQALAAYGEDMRDQFEESIARAVRRRRELDRIWRTPRAHTDAAHRRGWIAFEEYFAEDEEVACRDAA
jgi:geranylgeranyl reductase family protein